MALAALLIQLKGLKLNVQVISQVWFFHRVFIETEYSTSNVEDFISAVQNFKMH